MFGQLTNQAKESSLLRAIKMDKKTKHGGSRKGAGRPAKYGEETEMVTFRIPVSLKQKVIDYVERLLRAAAKKKNKNGT